MPLLLIEELAKHLELPAEDVNNALTEFVSQVKSDLENNQPALIPGVGTFEQIDGSISFTPADPLALAVNNRYAALDSEMIQLGFEEPEFPLSETLEEGNEQEIDQSLIDQIIADEMASKNLFVDNQESTPVQESIETPDPFDGDLTDTEFDNENSPTPDAQPSEPEVEPVSMKEEDPNTNNKSNQDPLGADSEWSPFFEELEGEEFDIENTIDLSAEDWQADAPAPPPSPFASSSDSSNTNADDLYFDVDADPDDTLFAPAASIEVENPSSESDDMSWASAPMDDITDFFDDTPKEHAGFNEEADMLSSISTDDEFFSPVSGSVNVSPDDTMFSAETETIYEDASTEADDTIFLAPDQTVSTPAVEPELPDETYAPKADPTPEAEAAAPPPRRRSPYAYQEQRKKSTSAFPWIAAVIAGIVVVGGGLALWQGWLPFGSSETPPPQNVTSAVPVDPTPTPPAQSVDPIENPQSTPTQNPVDPPASAAGTSETPDPTPAVVTPPPVQRIGIDRSRGGWTIIVTSKEARAEAESIADNFAETFGASPFPIDILTTNQFAHYTVSCWRRAVFFQR